MFMKINSIILPIHHTDHNYLYRFINEFSTLKNNFSLIKLNDLQIVFTNESRQQLLFWAILQRLIHSGMSNDLFDTSVYILHDIWDSIDKNNKEDSFNLETFHNILIIIDTIIENSCSSLLTVHKSLHDFLTVLNMRQLSYNGQISINGLLKWHYFHQLYNNDRCNAIYPYCQTINTKITDGIYKYNLLSQYQLCIVSFYRWHLEHLANLSTQYAGTFC